MGKKVNTTLQNVYLIPCAIGRKYKAPSRNEIATATLVRKKQRGTRKREWTKIPWASALITRHNGTGGWGDGTDLQPLIRSRWRGGGSSFLSVVSSRFPWYLTVLLQHCVLEKQYPCSHRCPWRRPELQGPAAHPQGNTCWMQPTPQNTPEHTQNVSPTPTWREAGYIQI